jgi:prevent-host-death family protein
MEEIGIEMARATLGEIVDRARFTGQPTRITRQGKAAAVVVSADWYENAIVIIDAAPRDLLREPLPPRG